MNVYLVEQYRNPSRSFSDAGLDGLLDGEEPAVSTSASLFGDFGPFENLMLNEL
jgi:hypothetical protein